MNATDTRTLVRIQCLAAVGLSLASAACSGSVGTAPRAVPPVSLGAATCHPTSRAEVLARRVFVPGGVEASEQDGGFRVRFAASASRCIAVEWPADSSPRPASCPASDAATARRGILDETMFAWESHDYAGTQMKLGLVTSDAPHAFLGIALEGRAPVGERDFLGTDRGAATAAGSLTAIGHDRFLVAWVDGSVEAHQLRAQSVVGSGELLGAPMVLSPADASVIGHPSVVVGPGGYGLVTYVAARDGEFDVLATPVACEVN